MIQHRFKDELTDIENNQMFCGNYLSGTYDYLIIGTFNPDDKSGPTSNKSKWYYGTDSNRFWYLLPMMLENTSLHVADNKLEPEELINKWKAFCLKNRIVIVDLIKSVGVNDKLINKEDKTLNIKLVESGGDFEAFNFDKAFKNVLFKKVLFTRSGWKIDAGIDVLVMSKIRASKILSNYLTPGGLIHNLHTPRDFDPNGSYYKTREQVLAIWKKEIKM